ncbi:hypothetical protein [Actinomadura chibensis]|uniref:Uncharacterized protein n=1 Tax=Actinomadura chibensis TaxID=392828 RepID=A0A5D0NW77_9ACTN|nr:hypothetical protein [Actinomadura chibensis]TYB48479.1 hypothetical protein FXF69_04615 [Actinomadura chibensis]
MTPENGTETTEAAHMDEVDVNPAVHHATESDEERVLTELYGAPDADGIYRGADADEEADDESEESDGSDEEDAG